APCASAPIAPPAIPPAAVATSPIASAAISTAASAATGAGTWHMDDDDRRVWPGRNGVAQKAPQGRSLRRRQDHAVDRFGVQDRATVREFCCVADSSKVVQANMVISVTGFSRSLSSAGLAIAVAIGFAAPACGQPAAPATGTGSNAGTAQSSGTQPVVSPPATPSPSPSTGPPPAPAPE